jgi:hypothetical protein
MDSNFDFDINNYNVYDLINFFNLPRTYNVELLERKVDDMQKKIFSLENSQYNPKYKFDIVNFIKLAKDVLISAYYDIQSQNEIQKVNDREKDPMRLLETKVGKIINPLATHPALQDTKIMANDISGYKYNDTFMVYVFNTVMRDNFYNSCSTDCTFTLPIKLKNVFSLTLSSIQFPNVFFSFSAQRGTNQLYISEDTTNLSGVVVLPNGNYSASPDIIITSPNNSINFALEYAINSQILGITNPLNYRFFVQVDPVTNFTRIFNNTYTFSMRTITNNLPVNEGDFCSSTCGNDNFMFNTPNIQNFPNREPSSLPPNSQPTPKLTDLKPYQYTQTLGYLLGYREIIYDGSSSYISESTFNGQYSNYVYLTLDDHTGSQQRSSTYGILPDSVIDNDVLAFITLNASSYSYVFNNTGDLIYKRRLYFGPVDISKISVKLLDQYGQIVNLLQNDFSFSITINANYNLKTAMVPIINPIV